MSIPDLGEIKARNAAKAAVPPYEVGRPTFTLPSAVPVTERGPSFTDALDRAAVNLAVDGWRIVTVHTAALVNIGNTDEGQPVAVFEITLQAERVPAEDETDAEDSNADG